MVVIYLCGLAGALFLFWMVPEIWWAQWGVIFLIGFFLYGPQMLIGLCGAELVGPSAVGASQGFLGWIAYAGAGSAGYPLSVAVKHYGWNIFFMLLIGACGAGVVLLLPIVGAHSALQLQNGEGGGVRLGAIGALTRTPTIRLIVLLLLLAAIYHFHTSTEALVVDEK